MSSKRNRTGGKGRDRASNNDASSRKKFSLLSRGFETLEIRSLLAADSGAFTNPVNQYDVNNNGRLEQTDLLALIDNLNRLGPRSLLASSSSDGSIAKTQAQSLTSSDTLTGDEARNLFIDVNSDGEATIEDVLMVTHALNTPPDPSMRITLEAVGLDGEEIPNNTLTVGEIFYIKVTGEDLATNIEPGPNPGQPSPFQGVFSAFLDIAYTGALAEMVGTPGARFAPEFIVTPNPGTKVTEGSIELIDEVGAANSASPSSQAPQTVVYIPMQATAITNNLVFTPQAAGKVGTNGAATDSKVYTYSGYTRNGNVTTFIPLTAADIEFVASTSLTVLAASSATRPSVVSISPASFAEGSSAATRSITVTIQNSNFDSTISWATVDGSATATINDTTGAPRDYDAASGILTFAAGETSKTIQVRVIGDSFKEGNEDFKIVLFDPLNFATNPGVAEQTITIVDETADLPGIYVGNAVVTETAGGSTATFTVTRTPSVATASSVTISTADGTAVAGRDYTAMSQVLNFAANETSKQVTVNILNDIYNEVDETFSMRLTNLSGAVRLKDGTGTISANDTSGPLGIAINSPAAITEGNSGTSTMTFTVSLSAVPTTNVTVNYATQNVVGSATAGSDYVATSGILTFTLGGSLTQTISVVVNGDTTGEANETFNVVLSNPSANASLENTIGVGTISNDDSLPLPTANLAGPVQLNEGNAGNTTFAFTVNLSATATQQILIPYSTSNGTATAGSDYTAANATLTIAAGQSSGTINILVTGDAVTEANETFTVTLGTPTNATLGTTTSATGTITNDDFVLSISAPTAQNEGNTGDAAKIYTFPVTLSASPTSQVKVVVNTSNGTALASDGDYTSVSNLTLTFAAGTSTLTQNVTVNVLGDNKDEANETFNVVLSSATGATLSGGGATLQATATITDDDAAPTVTLGTTPIQQNEGNTGTTSFTFPVTLSAVSGQAVSVVYSTEATGANPASAGVDYTAVTSGTLVIAAGQTTGNIVITVNGDTVSEPNETFNVRLLSASNATLGATTVQQGVIVNDELTLSVAAPAAQNEGNTGDAAKVYTFPVTLSATPTSQVTVVVNTSNNTALVADGDYQAVNNLTLTFAAGTTTLSQNVTVNVLGDNKDEANETFNVTLSSASGASLSGGGATLQVSATINDDDPTPTVTLSANPTQQNEGNSGTTNFVFPVTLSAVSGRDVSIVYSTEAFGGANPATAGSDYTAVTSGTLVIAAGQTTGNIIIAVSGDTVAEQNETFNVRLLSASNATLGTTTVQQGVIVNDEFNLSIGSPTPAPQPEGATGSSTVYSFPVTLSGGTPSGNVTVIVNAVNGTATSGDGDFQALNQTLTFTPSGPFTQNVSVTVNGDNKDEADEAFSVQLSNASGATIVTGTSTFTITDDDPLPTITLGNAVSLSEGNSGPKTFAFAVNLNAASGRNVLIPFSTSNGSATSGSDYTATSGTLTIAAGSTSGTINVVVSGDTTPEADETFTLNLGAPTNGTVSGSSSVTGTIVNDDLTISISPPAAQNEGAAGQPTTYTFAVSLGGGVPAGPVTVVYGTTNGTATTADGDYSAANGTLTFDANNLTRNVTVVVNGDAKDEDNETFNVVLSNPSGAAFVGGAATLTSTATVNDDDPAPTVSIAASSKPEGNSGPTTFPFTVSLDQISSKPVTVLYSTANGTAAAGSDYTAVTSGTLVIAAGQQSGTINIVASGDTLSEADETFTVTLLPNPTNAILGQASATGTIQNDDAPPGLSITGVTQNEDNSGNTTFTFNVALNPGSGQEVRVEYTTESLVGDTATAGTDYQPTSGTLIFAPGSQQRSITVVVNGDTTNEANETFTVRLFNPVNTTIAGNFGSAVGTINNDDILALNITDPTVNENAGEVTFTVSLSAASAQAIVVPYTTSSTGATAIAGSDYTATSGNLTFAAGDTSKTVVVSITNDNIDELNETFKLNLTNPSGFNAGKTTGTATITDDDATPQLAIADFAQNEGSEGGFGNFEIPVSLTGQSDRTITVFYTTVDGTALGTRDYTPTSGTLVFNPGDTTKNILVSVRRDRGFEPDESFLIRLSAAVNADISDNEGSIQITNDDEEGSIDFSTLAGKVWNDSDDSWIAGVTIRLQGESDISGPVNLETVTNANGEYLFEDLEPGDYTIIQVQPGFYLDGAEQIGYVEGVHVGSIPTGTNDRIQIRLEDGIDATDYNFVELGIDPKFYSRRMLLASNADNPGLVAAPKNISSGVVEFSNLTPTPAGVWYSLDDGINGILSIIADGANGGGYTKISLYDKDMGELQTVTGSTGDARLDYTGTTGQPYFVRIYGTNTDVDVKLVNLVSIVGDTINVRGTTGDDTFEYNAAGSTHTYSINGVSYSLNPSEGKTVNFQGGAGNDSARLIDSAFDDELSGDNNTLEFTNDNGLSVIAEGIESARVESITGGDDASDLTATDYALELIGDWA